MILAFPKVKSQLELYRKYQFEVSSWQMNKAYKIYDVVFMVANPSINPAHCISYIPGGSAYANTDAKMRSAVITRFIKNEERERRG